MSPSIALLGSMTFDLCPLSSHVGMLRPECLRDTLHDAQQIPFEHIASRKWIFHQTLERERNCVLQRDALADEHSEIFDRELAQWQVPSPMTFKNKIGVGRRGTPVVIFELRQRTRSIHAS